LIMKNNKFKLILGGCLTLVALVILIKIVSCAGKPDEYVKIKSEVGYIENVISSTGTVLPKNRLEIKPPVNGRVDTILVKEGGRVKVGQTLAWMSSTERSALLDAARAQGEASLKYWKEAYKPISLISPIDGEVIVSKMQAGQTVTVNEAVIVLSDHLIIRSQVDETDIGKIKLDQPAFITLDAYPETKIDAKVEHLYYESKTVNNVTIYEVDLIPESPPAFIRSGMNASVNFIVAFKDDALLLPMEAVSSVNGHKVVYVSDGSKRVEKVIETGITGEGKIEVLSGVTAPDEILIKAKKYEPQRSDAKNNPFMPMRRKQTKSK